MRRLSLALLTVLVAMPLHGAHAQIIRGGRIALRDPQWWISASLGWQEGWTVNDGETSPLPSASARWDIADVQQYGLSIERSVRSGISIGVRGTTSEPTAKITAPSISFMPMDGQLVYVTVPAVVRVSQALGVVHVTSGRDFRSVFELGVGATIYSPFRHQNLGETLEQTRTDADFAFSFAYGLGYSFSRNFQVDVVQDLGTSLHQKTGLAAGEDRSARIRSTRLVARYGFGS